MKLITSIGHVFKALWGLLKAIRKLKPLIVISVILVLGLFIVPFIIPNVNRYESVGMTLIAIASIALYVKQQRPVFLELLIGIITVFMITWNMPRFIIFVTGILIYLLFTTGISSTKLASEMETILTNAAIFSVGSNNRFDDKIKEYKRIIDNTDAGGSLSSIVKAKCLRLLVFRGIPQNLFSDTIIATRNLSVVYIEEPLIVCSFVADLYHIGKQTVYDTTRFADHLLSWSKKSRNEPKCIFQIWEETKWLVFEEKLGPDEYFTEIIGLLQKGRTPAQVSNNLVERFSKKRV